LRQSNHNHGLSHSSSSFDYVLNGHTSDEWALHSLHLSYSSLELGHCLFRSYLSSKFVTGTVQCDHRRVINAGNSQANGKLAREEERSNALITSEAVSEGFAFTGRGANARARFFALVMRTLCRFLIAVRSEVTGKSFDLGILFKAFNRRCQSIFGV
jgi:hypothetical protein